MKKLIMIFLTLGLLAVILSGCNETTASGDENTSEGGNTDVVVVLKTLSSPYWKFVEAGAKQAFEDFEIKGKIVGPASESEIVEQINMMDDALSQNPGALVVAPTQPPTAVPVFEKYRKKDIPVLLVDTNADWTDKTTYIGTDNTTAGKLGGEYLASILQPGDKIAIIGGALGNTATDQRIKGAMDALEEAGFEIVANQPADSDRSKATNVMENMLQKNPDIKGVFSATDDMALGAIRAIESKKLDVKVIGTDGTIEAIEAVIAGTLAGSVAQNPFEMGYQGVENAIKAMKGEEIESRIDSGAEVISNENASERLKFLQSLIN